MDKLPAEILSEIFSNIHFYEKQECMLVCQLWANVVRSSVFLDTVFINKTYTPIRARQLLNLQPSKKVQVKNLVIQANKVQQDVLQFYPKCFPNVHALYVNHCSYLDHARSIEGNREQDNPKLKDFIGWISGIEVLEQYNYSGTGQLLLTLGPYNALKKLIIARSFLTLSNFRNNISFDFLANAPNITSITLARFTITLRKLEDIHSNLSSLESLKLDNITLIDPDLDRNTSLELVIPSNSLTTLLITAFHTDANDQTTTYLEFLRYIKYKYAHLREFRFIINSTQPVTTETEIKLVTTGILPLIQHFGCKIKMLEIDCSIMLVTLFTAMDSLGFNPQCLNLSLSYGPSKKILCSLEDKHNFIRELTLKINSPKWILRLLRNMKTLKTLKIKGMANYAPGYQRVYLPCTLLLEKIFNLCSNSLESLTIEAFGVDSFHQDCPPCVLQKLEIHSFNISESAYSFVYNCLQRVRYLNLDYMHTPNEYILIENLRLYRLDLHVPRSTYIKVFTEIDQTTRHFYPESEHRYNPTFTSTDQTVLWGTLHKIIPEEIPLCNDKKVHFELHSVQQLYINNMIAF